jgi:hypothetical protein
VPSDEAIRRIEAGEPVGTGAGQSAARTQAVAPLLAGFPRGTVATANPLLLTGSRFEVRVRGSGSRLTVRYLEPEPNHELRTRTMNFEPEP